MLRRNAILCLRPATANVQAGPPTLGRLLAGAALAALAAAAPASAQTGTDAKATKKITWQTKKPAPNKPGVFEWYLYARGSCLPECNAHKTLGPLKSEWNLTTGAWTPPPPGIPSPNQFDTGLQDCSVGKAQATLTCIVAPAAPVQGAADRMSIEASLSGWTYEYIAPGGFAQAIVEGKVSVPGSKGSYIPIGDRSGKVTTGIDVPKISGNGATFTDPIWLEFHKEGVGLVVSQKLFALDVVVDPGASLIWDGVTGITMDAPGGPGGVSIAAAYPGAWITSSLGPFGAVLQNGVFTPTGAWAGLPWILTTSAGLVVRAELPAAALTEMALEYTIPAALVASGGEYYPVLVYSLGLGDGGVSCYPDCNQDAALTVSDFGCFQTKFVTGGPYADCDGSGSLTVSDFGCFQTSFVLGCP